MKTILIVDDEANIREALKDFFKDEGFNIILSSNGEEALNVLRTQDLNLVISDLRMPKLSGEEFLKKALKIAPKLPIIILTAHATLETAVNAIKEGAFDIVTKPIDLDHLLFIVKKALNEKNDTTKSSLNFEKTGFESFFNNSKTLSRILEKIKVLAPSNATILISGEIGSGKELISKAIVHYSKRESSPVIKIDSSSSEKNTLEMELFGSAENKGKLEKANKGTLIIDEITELPSHIISKLLKAVDEKKFERTGNGEEVKIDLRLIILNSRDLEREVNEGKFKREFFYQINSIEIKVPPLRERREDILPLSKFFLNELANENKIKNKELSRDALSALFSYTWPGNIRELKNALESSLIISKSEEIELSDLPEKISSLKNKAFNIIVPVGSSLKEAEEKIIRETLIYTKNNKTKCSQILQIGRKTLHSKIKEYGIE